MNGLTAADGALLRVALYLLVFWPAVGYYVYRDATRRGLSSPLLLGVGFGFLGVPGAVLYEIRKRGADDAGGDGDDDYS